MRNKLQYSFFLPPTPKGSKYINVFKILFGDLGAFLIICTLVFLSSCNKNTKQNSEADATNPTLSVAEFSKKIKEDKNVVILDVRTPKEYAQEHLPNAILENMQEDSFNENIAKMDKNKTYLLYCKVGGRSSKALDIMKKAGFKQVFHLGGGIVDWEKVGEKTNK